MSEWWFNAVSATEAIFYGENLLVLQTNVMGGKLIKLCTAQLLSKTLNHFRFNSLKKVL